MEKKELDHPDYRIPGTNIVNFSKWSRENIPKPDHKLKIGQLVEVRYQTWFGDGACEKVHARLWIVALTRDCDGTALYTLANKRCDNYERLQFEKMLLHTVNGLPESSLTPIEATQELRDGHGALEWPED